MIMVSQASQGCGGAKTGQSNVKWVAAKRRLFPLSQHLQTCWSSVREGKEEHGIKGREIQIMRGKKRTES